MLAKTILIAALASLASVGHANPISLAKKGVAADIRPIVPSSPPALYGLTNHSLPPEAAVPVHAATLEARKDYEPGDEIIRTLCFCDTDPPERDDLFLDLDWQAHTILGDERNYTDHLMGRVYEFEYYNHRFVVMMHFLRISRMLILSNTIPHASITSSLSSSPPLSVSPHHLLTLSPHPRPNCSPTNHTQNAAWIPGSGFVGTGPAVPTFRDPHNGDDYVWRLCYNFHGDSLNHGDGDPDYFTLYIQDGGLSSNQKRAFPRGVSQGYPQAEVDELCAAKCKDTLGMNLFTRGGRDIEGRDVPEFNQK
ncbi:MAG: hypothetical protein Q9169_006826, partial [Polycauliona sp. 2 TL-2023]